MVDANFKLKLKDKDIPDTYMGSGWAYFVEESKFKSYLLDHLEDQTEVIVDFIFYTLTSNLTFSSE